MQKLWWPLYEKSILLQIFGWLAIVLVGKLQHCTPRLNRVVFLELSLLPVVARWLMDIPGVFVLVLVYSPD